MAKFFGYARVSDKKQVDRYGIPAQKKRIEDYYRYLLSKEPDLEWGGIVEDQDSSAYKIPFLQRPKGLELHSKLQEGDHVCFAYLDRAFRNTVDCLKMTRFWIERRIRIHFLDINIDTSTPFGEAFLTIAATFAQLDSRLKSERIKEALREKRKKGLRAANKRIDYRFNVVERIGDDVVLGENRKYSAYCRLAWQLNRKKGLSREEISRILESLSAKRQMRIEAPSFYRVFNPRIVRKMIDIIDMRQQVTEGKFNPDAEVRMIGPFEGFREELVYGTQESRKRFAEKVRKALGKDEGNESPRQEDKIGHQPEEK